MKQFLFMSAVLLSALMAHAQQVTVGDTDIRVTFFTPRTVHITKQPLSALQARPSMVVTTKPEQGLSLKTAETASTLTVSSDVLTVRVDKRTGLVSFAGRGVKMSEKAFSFEPRKSGPDQGAYRVNTTFVLQDRKSVV